MFHVWDGMVLSSLIAQGDYRAAVKFFTKALLIKERLLGRAHDETAMTHSHLASCYFAMSELELAHSHIQVWLSR